MNHKKIDTDALLSSLDIVEVVGRYMQLDKSGPEYEANCPFHNESTPSFKVSPSKQFYHCFGCGSHGDAIDFVKEYRGIEFREAVDEITGGKPPTTYEAPTPREPRKVKEEEAEWQPIIPVPDFAPPHKKTFAKEKKGKFHPGEFITAWPYHGPDGTLLGYAARFEWTFDGKRVKDVVPVTFCRNINTGEMKWKNISFPKPRPLYNLHILAAKPDAVVIICEGEKKADAAMRLLPDIVAVAWPGGGKAVKHTAWQPLRGRRALMWRDADDVGLDTAEAIAEALQGITAAFKIIDPPAGVPESWDLADAEQEGWTGARVTAHIKAAARLPICMQPKQERQPEPPPLDPPGGDYEHDEDGGESFPYKALGYDHGRYYYLAGRACQVVELSSSSHTKLNLLSIAPLSYWQRQYPASKDGNEAMWDMAANALMRQCEDAGVYDTAKIRGRGAWWDDGRSLLHVGDCLIIDGEQRALTDPSVRFVYEAAPPLHLDMHNPLSAREAYEFVKLCQMLQWEKPISGMLMAGWVFLAPICGALHWRPHIWITGGAGTGKSWVQTNIVAPCVGNTAITPQGVATEAGIRQLLGMDARPVIFDEAEGEDASAQARIQSIMALARQASSETGGAIIKGSANGKAMTYRIRSMFGFSSIGVGVQQYADKTRVTVLGLTVDQAKSEDQKAAGFAALQAKAASLLTEEYASRLRARAVHMIGAIRENAKTFAAAGAAVIGTQRLGDQIGTMLAGAYALHNNGLITPEDAREWLGRQDWSEETALHEVKDELRCMSHILEHRERITGPLSTVDRSIGELIKLATGSAATDGSIQRMDAEDHLLRIGIKVAADGVVIANTHTAIAKILTGTLWAREWGRILKRLPGAKAHETTRFGSGGSHRGVTIPNSLFAGK